MGNYTEFERQFFRVYGRLPTVDESASGVARADAQPKLIMSAAKDETGREIREFAYDEPGARKDWMDAHRAPLQRMLFINVRDRPKGWCEKRAVQMLADEQATAKQIAQHGIESIRVDLGA
jgi:hypothetical protein